MDKPKILLAVAYVLLLIATSLAIGYVVHAAEPVPEARSAEQLAELFAEHPRELPAELEELVLTSSDSEIARLLERMIIWQMATADTVMLVTDKLGDSMFLQANSIDAAQYLQVWQLVLTAFQTAVTVVLIIAVIWRR